MRLRTAASVAALACRSSAAACGSEATSRPRPTPRPEGRTDLVGHLGPEERGPGVPGAHREVRAEVPERQGQLRRCPSARRRTSSRPRPQAKSGAPDILRAEVAWVPEFASLGYLYAAGRLGAVGDESDYLPSPLRRTSTTARPTACRRSPTRWRCSTTRRSSPTPGITEAPKTWAEVKTAAADDQGQDRRRRPRSSTPAATSCCRSSTARAATWSTPRTRRSWSTPTANVAGIKVAQDLVTSGAAVKPPANDSYGT